MGGVKAGAGAGRARLSAFRVPVERVWVHSGYRRFLEGTFRCGGAGGYWRAFMHGEGVM